MFHRTIGRVAGVLSDLDHLPYDPITASAYVISLLPTCLKFLVRRSLMQVGATIWPIMPPKHSIASTLAVHTFPIRPTPGTGACSDHLICPHYRRRNVHASACLIVLIAPPDPLSTCLVLPLAGLDTGVIYELRLRVRCVRQERRLRTWPGLGHVQWCE